MLTTSNLAFLRKDNERRNYCGRRFPDALDRDPRRNVPDVARGVAGILLAMQILSRFLLALVFAAASASAATTSTVVDVAVGGGVTNRILHVRPDAPIATLSMS